MSDKSPASDDSRPRIVAVGLDNYKSIVQQGDEGLRLGDLTVLVGPNGSGKSSYCDAISFVADSMRFGLEAAVAKRHGINAIRRWSIGRPKDVYVGVLVDFGGGDNWARYRIEISGSSVYDYQVKSEDLACEIQGKKLGFYIKNSRWISGPADLRPSIDPMNLALPLIAADERFKPIVDAIKNVSIYSIYPDVLREPQKPDHTRPMDEYGSNWCSVLKDIAKGPWEADFIAAMGQLTGDIDDFRVRQVGGYLLAAFRHGSSPTKTRGRARSHRPIWFDSAQESDGTLRMAGILTALLQQPSPSLIGIEEPEATVHPGAIPLLFDHLKEASTRGQVLITTHSPDLLDLLDAEDVRVVERRNGVTNATPMDAAQRLAVRDRLFTPGTLMRMEGLKQQQTDETTAGSGI